MNDRKLTQREINKIVNTRLYRVRDRLIKDFEARLKRCMASLHLLLHTEMMEMKREMETHEILEDN